jgi:hypothetical protein
MSRLDPHRLAEERSLALHRLIAARIAGDPAVVPRARARVARWLDRGEVAAPWAHAWAELLDGPVERLLETLVVPGEEARALRQVTPFAGVVDPRTRWRIWREVAGSRE